jgi:hypothetical protein
MIQLTLMLNKDSSINRDSIYTDGSLSDEEDFANDTFTDPSKSCLLIII